MRYIGYFLAAVLTLLVKEGAAIKCYVCSSCPDPYSSPESNLQAGCDYCQTISTSTGDSRVTRRYCRNTFFLSTILDKCTTTSGSSIGFAYESTTCNCKTESCNGQMALPSNPCYSCSEAGLGGTCGDEYVPAEAHKRKYCDYCKKEKNEYAGIKSVSRSCQTGSKPAMKCTSAKILGYKTTTCYCEGPNCNAGSKVAVTFSLVSVLVAIAFI